MIESLQEPAAVAVGPDGGIHVCEALGARISVFDRRGALLRRWGSFGRGMAQLDDPRGIAVADDGTVYVADTGNHRIQVFNAAGEFLHAWGRFGADSGEFNEPRGLAVSAGRVYVADARNDRVQIFDRSGTFQRYVWSYGDHDGAFDYPVDVAVDRNGAFFVSDQGNSRLQKFDAAGRFVTAFSGSGDRGGLLMSPNGIDQQGGRLFVSDPRSHRVAAFDTAGTFLGDWATNRATDPSRLEAPSDVATVPGSDDLVICSATENRCQIVSIEHELIAASAASTRPEVREGYTIGGSGDHVVVASPERGALLLADVASEPPQWLLQLGSPGHEPLEFVRPSGFCVGRQANTVLVSDSGNRRLQRLELAVSKQGPQRYDPIGTRFIKSIDFADPEALRVDPGGWEITPLSLEPGAIACDSSGQVWVLDIASRRVVVLDRRLHLVRAWGTFGDEDGALRQPVGIALDKQGKTVFVLDAGQRRVQSFAPDGQPRTAWGARGTEPGQFLSPSGIAVAGDGSVFVVDRAAARVQRFDSRGSVRGMWGTQGSRPGEFNNPEGIYIDGHERVLVLDSGNRRLQAFAPSGTFLWELPLDRSATAAQSLNR